MGIAVGVGVGVLDWHITGDEYDAHPVSMDWPVASPFALLVCCIAMRRGGCRWEENRVVARHGKSIDSKAVC